MIKRITTKVLLLLLGCGLVWPAFAAEPAVPSTTPPPAVAEHSETSTNVFHPIKPGPDDGRIAFTTAWMLEHSQFLRQRFSTSVSSKFFDRYLEVYDPQHLHFLQADLAEFARYRTNLNQLTLNRRGADTTPACDIFNRFMDRLEQHVACVDELLKTEKFDFDNDERIVINRKELPYPKDLSEARKLWRDRLRAEYLQEKLAKVGAKKKSAKTASGKAPKTEADTTPADPSQAGKPKTEREEIVDTLHRRYHRNLHAFSELRDDDVLGIYLTTLAHVYDPHSDYMTASQLESFQIAMNLRLEGIGAELRSEDGYCIINRLLPGPAAKSKRIKEGDRIIAVAQSNSPPVDLVDMRLDKAVQLIRGPKGTQVRLTILPANADASARFSINLTRDEIKLEDQEAKAKVIEVPNGNGGNLRLGLIDLPSFYASMDLTVSSHGRTEPKSTSADVRKLLEKLRKENVGGVILDLRHNGGGSLEEAIKLTGLFIKDGPVVQVANYDGSVEVEPDRDSSVTYDGPLIVLTSRLSASASEILAAALQDYGRALIVGDTSTHGKGTVQSLVPVNLYYTNLMRGPALSADPGAMKITIKKFYRPSGSTTQLKGVVPDIILPSILGESKEIGESTLDNPLPPDSIRPAKFDHLDLVAPFLADLRKRSAERLATDPEYAYIREDIALYKKLQADKTISLDEKQRIKQKEEDDARSKARQQERAARKSSPEIVHELTLRQVDLPGLPPPTNSIAKVSAHSKPGSPGGVTNAANTPRESLTGQDDLGDEFEDEKPPAYDAALAETEHILVDYLTVFPKPGPLTAGTTGPAAPGTSRVTTQ